MNQQKKPLRVPRAFAVRYDPENPVNPVKKTMKIAAISPQPFVLFVAFCKMPLEIGMERWQKALALRKNRPKTKDLHRLKPGNPRGGAA